MLLCFVISYIAITKKCPYYVRQKSDLNQKFFMSDYSEAEIAAVKSSFPSMTLLICDFHREQAWECWVKDRKHGVTVQEAEELLNYLHECA